MKVAGREWTVPQLLLVGLTSILVIGVIISASTTTSAFGIYNSAWNGASGLSHQADIAGAQSDVLLNTSAYTKANPDQTIAFILSPKTRYNRTDQARLRQFVKKGGTIVVADDFGSHGNEVLHATGAAARFNGQIVRDEHSYYHSPALPNATNVSNKPQTANVNSLTLNHGTVIEPHNATPLIQTSQFAYLDTNQNGQLDNNESMGSMPVVTVETVGHGHVIAVSDPSIFINAMLKQPGNEQFVQNLIGTHNKVLLDYSHAGSQPPLAVALLLLRQKPLAQLLFGIAGLSFLVSWPVWTPIVGSIFANQRHRDIRAQSVDEDTLMQHLQDRYPDWEEERLHRVVSRIIQKNEGEDNE